MVVKELSGDAWKPAQMCVIGALLLWPDEVAGKIFHGAMAAYFGDSSLKHLFEAAHGLWIEGKAIDPITVLHAAGDAQQETVAACMDMVPAHMDVDEYLHILRDEARLYQIRMAASELSWAKSMEDALDAYEKMGQLLRDTDTIEDVSWEEMVGSYLDRMNDPAPPNYLTWGIPQLDETLCVSPGDFCVLAADSSVGKTALALQFAFHMAQHGKRTLFFSLETPREKLEDRLMAETQVAAIPMLHTKKKALSSDDYLRAGDTGMKSGKVPLRVIRRAETLPQIQNRIIMKDLELYNIFRANGMTRAGALGTMANIRAEGLMRGNNAQDSYGFDDVQYTAAVDTGNPEFLERFCTDLVGYGYAQWTDPKRKRKLLAYAMNKGTSIGDECMQAHFIIKEMKEDLQHLKAFP